MSRDLLPKVRMDGGERRKFRTDFYKELEKRWKTAIPKIQERFKENGIEKSEDEIKELFNPENNRIIHDKMIDNYLDKGVEGIEESYYKPSTARMKREKRIMDEIEMGVDLDDESDRDGENY